MKEPSKEQIKERTKYLRQILKEKHKIELPHGHALEVMAKVFGFNDWNTASAMSLDCKSEMQTVVKSDAITSKELPIVAKLRTAGEYVDFFSKFDRNKKIVVNEYEDNELGHFGTTTSVCSLSYDSEIQNEAELRLELNTEEERIYELQDFGKSSRQTFEPTKAGRYQRIIKWFHMQDSFWNPAHYAKSDRKS